MTSPPVEQGDIVPREPEAIEIVARTGAVERLPADGVPLPPGLADDLRALVTRSALDGAKRLLAGDKPMTVVLDPSKDVAKRLRTGELVLTEAKDKTGRILAQARDVKTGQIAENIKVKPADGTKLAKSGAKAASAGAAAAWQIAAIATQQHYLVEISGRLSGIEAGVSDVVRGQLLEKAAELETTEEDLQRIQEHIDTGVRLDSNDRQDVNRWYKQARSIRTQALKNANAILADQTRDPADALPDLMLADHAMRTALRCATVLLRLPTDDEQRRLNDFWHCSLHAKQGLDDVNAAVVELERRRLQTATQAALSDALQPQELHRKAWNRTAGQYVGYQGVRPPKFRGLLELPSEQKRWLQDRSAIAARQPEAVPATVVLDGERALLTS